MCQGSSVVEQGTHKPLVASSTLAPGTNYLLVGKFRWCSQTSVAGSVATPKVFGVKFDSHPQHQFYHRSGRLTHAGAMVGSIVES